VSRGVCRRAEQVWDCVDAEKNPIPSSGSPTLANTGAIAMIDPREFRDAETRNDRRRDDRRELRRADAHTVESRDEHAPVVNPSAAPTRNTEAANGKKNQ